MARVAGLFCVAVALALFAWPVVAAGCAASAPPPAENDYWKNADRADLLPLCDLQVTSATSEGLSLFVMDPAAGKIVQLRFAAGDTLQRLDLASPIAPAQPGDAINGVLVLGPRAFYALSTVSGNTIPTLFRADRVPTAISGGWKVLRPIAGPADLGLSAVVMNQTIWMLRSDSTTGFAVDWQPVATENNEQLSPPGPTISLGTPDRARPAAGVTATRDSIYVFGGRLSPMDAIRIPLVNASPDKPVSLKPLAHSRQGASALVHANTVYLVGGNDPGTPAIERSRIQHDGTLSSWERYPEPPDGAPILTATFARDFLWIFRADGSIQKSRIGLGAPGRARIEWHVDQRPRFVKPGDSIDIPIDWSYSGPQELDRLSATASGSPAELGARHPTPFVSLAQTSFQGVTLTEPSTDGPPFNLVGHIPTDRRRSEYLALVQIKAGDRPLGPILRLRFVVERTRR